MSTREQVQADLASLRRVAQQLRANRQLDGALQIEKIIAGREVELAAMPSAVPAMPFTITKIAHTVDHEHRSQSVTITSGRYGVLVEITATTHGEHAQARAGWQALNRAIELLSSVPLGDVTSSRMMRITETWVWDQPLSGQGGWTLDTARRES